jgi:hypothetical protein
VAPQALTRQVPEPLIVKIVSVVTSPMSSPVAL